MAPTEKPDLRKPLINLSGTHGPDLLKQYVDVHQQLSDTLDLMQQSAPHGRDYPLGGLNEATMQHCDRYYKIEHIRMEIAEIMDAIHLQIVIRSKNSKVVNKEVKVVNKDAEGC